MNDSALESIIPWLLDSDPSIRWQTLRDLSEESDSSVRYERSRMEHEGWGARLLDLQAPDGYWGGAAFVPRAWISTLDTLQLLVELGIDPAGERTTRAVELVRQRCTWGAEFGDSPYFEGEVEPCINGRTLAAGAYFGVASLRLLDRLLGEQLPDGGWNCEAPPSVCSSFHSTICVLEGLLAYETTYGRDSRVTSARRRGEEYLLERSLFRSRSTGKVIDEEWTRCSFPVRWRYDILRAADYLRSTGERPDPRIAETVAMLLAKRDTSGRWPLEKTHAGRSNLDLGERDGSPSRWNTLRALRVVKWFRSQEVG